MITMTLYCDVKLVKPNSNIKPGQGCYEKSEPSDLEGESDSLLANAKANGWSIHPQTWRVACPYCNTQRRKR